MPIPGVNLDPKSWSSGGCRLKQSGLKIVSADNLADAAQKIVKAVKEAA